jgi:hypothetical protein
MSDAEAVTDEYLRTVLNQFGQDNPIWRMAVELVESRAALRSSTPTEPSDDQIERASRARFEAEVPSGRWENLSHWYREKDRASMRVALRAAAVSGVPQAEARETPIEKIESFAQGTTETHDWAISHNCTVGGVEAFRIKRAALVSWNGLCETVGCKVFARGRSGWVEVSRETYDEAADVPVDTEPSEATE